VKPRLPLGKVYEVEVLSGEGSSERVVTRAPVSIAEARLGVGDAWALVAAANAAWNGKQGEWVSLYDPGIDS